MNARKNSGYVTPGPIGTILFIGIVAAVIAVAKYKPESEQKKDTTADKQTLDKRNPS